MVDRCRRRSILCWRDFYCGQCWALRMQVENGRRLMVPRTNLSSVLDLPSKTFVTSQDSESEPQMINWNKHNHWFPRNATFQVSTAENRVQRGQFGPFRASWEHTRMASVFQVSGIVLKLVMMILIACIVLGEDDPENNKQAVVLLSISIVYLVILRIFRPYSKR